MPSKKFSLTDLGNELRDRLALRFGPLSSFVAVILIMRIYPLIMSNRRRQWAAWLYLQITSASRRRLRLKLSQAGRYPIAVLFYHRVSDVQPNSWTISPRNFVKHLDWLEENFDIVSLSEAQRRIRSPLNSRPTVALTFDDGYAENCKFAIPEIVRRGLPATYFVVTDAIASGKPFAHDVRQRSPLVPNSLSEIQEMHRAGIEIGAHTRTHCDLGRVVNPTELTDEICGCLEHLSQWGLGPTRYFSFPYGLPENTSQAAVDLLMKCGLEGFCTAYGAWNWPDSPGYHLRRIHADPGMQTLKRWLTLDPRKLTNNWRLPFSEPEYCSSGFSGPPTLKRLDLPVSNHSIPASLCLSPE